MGSSSTTETLREFEFALVVQAFEGGIVTVRGQDLLFSIICLPPMFSDLLFMFTASVMFFTTNFHYMVW